VKIIPEKRRALSIRYLRFFSTMEARYTYIDMLSNNEYVCVHFNIQNRNFKRANNLNVFGTNKTKGPKQDSQNRPWQPIPAGANNTSFDKNCII
jgi:hypothetical protein